MWGTVSHQDKRWFKPPRKEKHCVKAAAKVEPQHPGGGGFPQPNQRDSGKRKIKGTLKREKKIQPASKERGVPNRLVWKTRRCEKKGKRNAPGKKGCRSSQPPQKRVCVKKKKGFVQKKANPLVRVHRR